MMIFAIEAFEEWENSLCKGLAWAYKCLARLPLQAQPTTHSQSLFREAPSSSMQCKKMIFVAVHWCFSVERKRGLLCTVWSCRAQQAGSPISCFLLPIFGQQAFAYSASEWKLQHFSNVQQINHTAGLCVQFIHGKHTPKSFSSNSMLHSFDVLGK